MGNDILTDIAVTFAAAMYAFPVIILGMWLSTKSWCFYFLAVAGFAWMAFVISGSVYDIWLNPDVSTSVKIASWSIPPIFFVVLNIGTVVSIRNMKALKRKKE